MIEQKYIPIPQDTNQSSNKSYLPYLSNSENPDKPRIPEQKLSDELNTYLESNDINHKKTKNIVFILNSYLDEDDTKKVLLGINAGNKIILLHALCEYYLYEACATDEILEWITVIANTLDLEIVSGIAEELNTEYEKFLDEATNKKLGELHIKKLVERLLNIEAPIFVLDQIEIEEEKENNDAFDYSALVDKASPSRKSSNCSAGLLKSLLDTFGSFSNPKERYEKNKAIQDSDMNRMIKNQCVRA